MKFKVTFYALKNVGECERINPQTPKWVPILGVGVLIDSRILKK
jgi:hypothetical protein